MELLKFVEALVPSLERARILEDISITESELNEQTLPAYRATVDANPFANGLRSPWCRDFQRDYAARIRLKGGQDTYIQSIHATLLELPKRLEWLRKEITENFADDLSARGITFPKANMLALLQAIGFAVRYSRKLLLATYGYELPHMKGITKGQAFAKAELKILDDQQAVFIRVMEILSRQDVTKQIDSVPNVVVDVNDANGAVATSGAQMDPLALGFLPYRWNPIYHIRLKIAEWQHARYEAAKAERQAIEMRLIMLRNARDGQKNPSVDQQIEYYDDQLQKLNRKIADMED